MYIVTCTSEAEMDKSVRMCKSVAAVKTFDTISEFDQELQNCEIAWTRLVAEKGLTLEKLEHCYGTSIHREKSKCLFTLCQRIISNAYIGQYHRQ